MGEAKIRKASDPKYGKVPKESQSRGLIISNRMKIDPNKHSISGLGGFDPGELRFSLLYWDKLVYPNNNLISFGGGEDEEFLISAGVLSKIIYTYTHGEAASIVFDTYMRAFSDLENREPGVWSLSQGEKSLFINNSAANLIDESGISLELIRSIPVPAADVPLNEILEFKEKRKDELMIFRAHIDKLVFEIQNSPARTDTFNRIAQEVDAACADLLKVGHEWQWPFHFSNFKATFNLDLDKFLNAAKAGWELLEPYGPIAQTSAAAVSGLVSTINVKPDISLRSIKKLRGPYRYTLLAHKELV
jgi:hypothetical protein